MKNFINLAVGTIATCLAGNAVAQQMTFRGAHTLSTPDSFTSSVFGYDLSDAPNQFSFDSLTSPLTSSVPEPSSSLLIVLSVFPLALQRKRKGKTCK